MKPPLASVIPVYVSLLTALLWVPPTLLQLDSFLLADLRTKRVSALLSEQRFFFLPAPINLLPLTVIAQSFSFGCPLLDKLCV